MFTLMDGCSLLPEMFTLMEGCSLLPEMFTLMEGCSSLPEMFTLMEGCSLLPDFPRKDQTARQKILILQQLHVKYDLQQMKHLHCLLRRQSFSKYDQQS